jgi:hypothetical protein
MTWQDLLTLHKDKFDGKKNVWHPEEIALAYQIWNEANRDKFSPKADVGCGSCRRAVITGVVKLAQSIIK